MPHRSNTPTWLSHEPSLLLRCTQQVSGLRFLVAERATDDWFETFGLLMERYEEEISARISKPVDSARKTWLSHGLLRLFSGTRA
jgi:hypothetical protein